MAKKKKPTGATHHVESSEGKSIFITAPLVRRTKWEYWRALNSNFATFNSLGLEGWELIAVVDHYSYFKRPS